MRESWAAIYAAVRRVPRGKVATYGQIAALAGLPRRARLVGYALAALSETPVAGVPWHRVINSAGRVSGRSEPMFVDEQRARLEREGVVFSASGRTSLERFQWRARPPRR